MDVSVSSCTRCKKSKTLDLFAGKNGAILKMCRSCRTAKYESAKKAREVNPGGTVRDDGYVKCSHCPRWCPPTSYIGKKGTIVARCEKCRSSGEIHDAKLERRTQRNTLQKKHKYYASWRTKEIAKDYIGYRDNINKTRKVWYAKNIDHMRSWARSDINLHLSSMKHQARKKGYVWNIEDDTALSTMRSPCFYCGYIDETTKIGGIDRMNNRVGYEKYNCVACCTTCNFMKTCLDANTFVERCRRVAAFCGKGNVHDTFDNDIWRDVRGVCFGAYRNRAVRKNIPFELSRDQFSVIRLGSCTYCGKPNTETHRNGIDRVDSSKGYELSNCVACCGECNHAKRDIASDIFIQKCEDISGMEHTIPAMPRCTSVIYRRFPPIV
jgi:hypothetical protein